MYLPGKVYFKLDVDSTYLLNENDGFVQRGLLI